MTREPVTGPPDDYTTQLKEAAHEVLSMTDPRIEDLLAEIERLNECCNVLEAGVRLAWKERDELRAEVERLRARNADLEEQILHALGEARHGRHFEPKP